MTAGDSQADRPSIAALDKPPALRPNFRDQLGQRLSEQVAVNRRRAALIAVVLACAGLALILTAIAIAAS